MTSVNQVISNGNGEILANFREIPAACKSLTERITGKLRQAGIGGILLMGNISETVCEIPVDVNRSGIVLIGGLNPVAAAYEANIAVENYAMSALMEYQSLVKFSDLCNGKIN
jgi:repressor of nif and glnA expression